MDPQNQPQQNGMGGQSPRPEPIPSTQMPSQKKDSSAGPVVGTIIIIVILAFGALYFYGSLLNKQQEQLPYIPGDETGANAVVTGDPATDAANIDTSIDTSGIDGLDTQINADLNALDSQL